MREQCVTCDEEALHEIEYNKLFNNYTHWKGRYCNKCFYKKLEGMAKAWRNYEKDSN